MFITIQTPTRQIWVTHYHLTSKVTSRLSCTAYLLCLAENTETYFQQIEHYLEQHQLTGQAQLTPLPIQTWGNTLASRATTFTNTSHTLCI